MGTSSSVIERAASARRTGDVDVERSAVAAETGRASRTIWTDAAALLLIAIGVRLVGITFGPDVDELHHVLAARSFLADGTLRIEGGAEYTRTYLFTYLVISFFKLFGESLVAARMPAILGGAALVVTMYLWVRSQAGRLAGWVAALLLCTYPFGIFITQVSRFYSLHALFFLLGVIAVFGLTTRANVRSAGAAGLALFALASFGLAWHFQVTTLIGLTGLGLWLLLDRGPVVLRAARDSRHRLWLIVGAVALAVLVAGALVKSGFASRIVSLFQYADPWAQDQRGNVRYYHRLLLTDYAVLWALFPVIVLVAAFRNARAALLCATIFGVALVVHSLAAWKHSRYLFYAMPLFFALAGMAAAEVVPALRRRTNDWLQGQPLLARLPVLRRVTVVGVVTVILGFGLLGNGALPTFVRMMAPGPESVDSPKPFRGKSDWAAATPVLEELSANAAVLVSYSHLKPLYYLNRLDVVLQRNHLLYGDDWQPEFSALNLTHRPVISSPESLARIVECHPSGVVLTEPFGWRSDAGVPAATADFIEQRLEPVPLPPEWRIGAYTWRSPDASPGSAVCADVVVGLQQASTR